MNFPHGIPVQWESRIHDSEFDQRLLKDALEPKPNNRQGLALDIQACLLDVDHKTLLTIIFGGYS